MSKIFISLMSSLFVASGTADVGPFRFSQVYKDHMVLQRAPHSASIWGWGPAGATVTVSIVGNTAFQPPVTAPPVIIGGDGKWRVSLPAQDKSINPVNISAKLSTGVTIGIGDVLFGDVWVCSGQSNMAFSVGLPLHDPVAEAKIKAAYLNDPGASPNGEYINTSTAINTANQYPNIRLMVVGNKHDCAAPIDDWSYNGTGLSVSQPWARASNVSVGSGPDVMGGAEPADGMSATCWYFGYELHLKEDVPIGLIHTSYGGSAVEDWISKDTLGDGQTGPCPGPIVGSMGQPSQQYNGQLHPLLNTTIKGAIWYQGESNNGQNKLYSCRYQQMMKEWRSEWFAGTGGATNPEFPIGFVQIGPMTGGKDSYEIRMGQTADFGYAPNKCWPNSFMAAAFDLGNPPGTKCISGCIHIFNKQAVAHRLAVGALHNVYNQSLVFSGPHVTQLVAGTAANTVELSYGVGTEGKGLQLRGGFGFQVCYQDCNISVPPVHVRVEIEPDTVEVKHVRLETTASNWFPATVASSTKNSIIIAGPTGQSIPIMAVSYGHYDEPSLFSNTQPCVFNGEGLPATPGTYTIGVVPAPACPRS